MSRLVAEGLNYRKIRGLQKTANNRIRNFERRNEDSCAHKGIPLFSYEKLNTETNKSVISSGNKSYTLVNFCEFDKYASKAYCAIHGVDESLNLGDITKVNEKEIADFTMMTWGFPCTDISLAGKQAGFLDENGNKTRSGMYYEGIRILREKKPEFSIIENVKNLVGKKFKNEFEMVLSDLEEAGYNNYWKVLNAKDYGSCQNRERVFILSIRKDVDNGKFEFPQPFECNLRLKDVLEDEVDERFYLSEKIQERLKIADPTFTKNIIGTTKPDFRTIGQRDAVINSEGYCPTLVASDFKQPKQIIDKQTEKLIQVGQMYGTEREPNPQAGRVYSAEGLSPTMDTCSGGNRMPKVLVPQATKKGYIECDIDGVADLSYPNSTTRRGRVQDGGQTSPTITATETGICKFELSELGLKVRKLTPKECYRLQTFSDEAFELAQSAGLSDTQLYKTAGNSICCNVLYYIYVELYKAMPYLFEDLKLSSFFSGIGAFEVALDRLYEDINSGNFNKPLV